MRGVQGVGGWVGGVGGGGVEVKGESSSPVHCLYTPTINKLQQHPSG